MTIHKAQGQTLDQVHLELGARTCFASGQLYTALSRVHSLEDLTLSRPLQVADVVVDEQVQLEDAASEFDIQGLELDWSCLVWDGDFRWNGSGWNNFSFTGNRWQSIRSEERKNYQINAYRVLLTRARQGMVICVPEGDPEDATRLPEFYDNTYEYLKQIGLDKI